MAPTGWGLTRRGGVMAAVAAMVILAAPAPASAHLAGGPEPSNYRSVVLGASAAMPGVVVSAVSDGDRIQISNSGDVPVTVLGYQGEDFLEIGPDGVLRNTNSLSAYPDGPPDRVPGGVEAADPGAAPNWETVSSNASWRWADRRTSWTGTDLPPQVRADPDRSHLVLTWVLPLRYGAATVEVTGSLTWYPPPSKWWSWPPLAALALVGACAGLVRFWPGAAAVALAAVVLADVVHLGTSTFPSDPSQDGALGLVIAGAALPTLVASLLAVMAWRSMRAGTGTAPFAIGIACWLIFTVGLSDVAVLWNSQLPVNGPDWLTRLAIAVSIGLGAGLGVGAYFPIRRQRIAYPAPRAATDGPI